MQRSGTKTMSPTSAACSLFCPFSRQRGRLVHSVDSYLGRLPLPFCLYCLFICRCLSIGDFD